VEGQRAEHRGAESQTASSVQKGCTPPRKVFVNRGDEGETVSNRDFIWGEGKAEIGLGEGGNSGAKSSRQGRSIIAGDSNGEECSLVIVNRKAGGEFKKLEDLFGGIDGFRRTADEDQRVIGVLDDMTGVIGGERVANGGQR
jgi:hypothetical protein